MITGRLPSLLVGPILGLCAQTLKTLNFLLQLPHSSGIALILIRKQSDIQFTKPADSLVHSAISKKRPVSQ